MTSIFYLKVEGDYIMKDFLEDNLLSILFILGVVMILINIVVIVYAVNVSIITRDLTTTISFKDKDIQDMQDYIDKITFDYNQLKLEKQDLKYNFDHCVQELPHGD